MPLQPHRQHLRHLPRMWNGDMKRANTVFILFAAIVPVAFGGFIAGAYFGHPFEGCGATMGCVTSLPLAVVFAVVCCRWQVSIVLIAIGEVVGAVTLYLLHETEMTRDLALHWPLLG